MSTERSRKYLEILKLPENRERYEDYLRKRRMINKKYTQKQLSNKKTAERFRRNQRNRVRKFRAKPVSKPLKSFTTSYLSISARSKAVLKAQKGLPRKLNNRQEVIGILAERNDLSFMPPKVSVSRPRRGFPEIENIVDDFYNCDLITRQMPGIRDFVIIKNNMGVKEKLQKRVLVMPITKAYEEFLKIFPQITICFSKFSSIRPKNVMLFTQEIQYSFKCVHCENAKFLFSSIARFIADFRNSLDDVMYKFCCDEGNFLCVSSTCPNCQDNKDTLMGILYHNCFNENVTYKEWKKNGGFTEKITNSTSTVMDVVSKILTQMRNLKMHLFLKKVQQQFFYDIKHSQPSNSATIVIDFAENYAAKGQNEVQSSYFGRKQVSLFTCAAWIGQDNHESFVFANDDLHHSKEQVHFYLKKIIEKLKEKYNLKKIIIFSDGSSSQFKNRYSLSAILFSQQDYDLDIEWHFFPTSHGKSSADGIGAVVKRGVHQRVMLDECIVYSAKEFVDCCKTFCKNIDVMHIKQDEIEEEAKFISQRWLNIQRIEGNRDLHCFKTSSNFGHIIASKSSLMYNPVEIRMLK